MNSDKKTNDVKLSTEKLAVLARLPDGWFDFRELDWEDNQKVGIHLSQLLKLEMLERDVLMPGNRVVHRLTELGVIARRKAISERRE